jgi:hypothetical protein
MAYLGKGPEQVLSGVASKSTFTGDGSTTTFDISTDIPAGGENDIQVFVDNVRQEPGSGASYTVGVDGSGNLRRITFNVAPEASQSIYVLNPRRIEAYGAVPDNTIATAKVQDNAVTVAKLASTLDLSSNTVTLPNDVVNADKIVDDAISEEHLDTTAVTGFGDLGANIASADQIIVYDQSSGTLKKISQTNFLNFPVVSSVSPTSVTSGDGTGNYTFTITGTGFTGASADLLNSSGTAVAFDSVTVDSSTQITGVIAKSSLPGSGEPYDVRVTAASGLKSTLDNQINIDQSPTYVTASGSLGSQAINTAGSFSVNATDPESAGNVTFELQSGSLPPGYSITNTAAEGGTVIISGTDSTTSSTTTFNFVLRAVDAASNTSSRSFSIQSRVPASESFTSSGTFSVPSGVTSADVLVVAAGGGGGGGDGTRGSAGGGGAGGLIFVPGYPVTPGGTITVTVGCGGNGAAASPDLAVNQGGPGSNTVFGSPSDPGLNTGDVLTALGGGGGNGPGGNGQPGGSGGGALGGANGSGGGATQPGASGQSGAYGFGNSGATMPGVSYGGGGGGAGAASGGGCQNAGAGKAYTISDGTTPVYYAGGGGGGGHGPSSPTGGTGGQGGGGNGGQSGQDNAQSGQANTGGGGGGGMENPGTGNGGGGGKGIVIVRY